ncbi:MAG: N-acetylneuraminate synthase family protein [Chloroflexi bacterium]|nr:N-acetylneuraminate synthase family protein [Chloroflexota bacterium]
MENIRIGDREIGAGVPCFLVAEIGINHNGDLELAKETVAAAAQAGADAVKFQNFRTEDFLSDRNLTYTYKNQGREITESQWDMFKRCEPPPEWWPDIKEQCDSLGIVFFSTPTSERGVDELVEVGAPLLKNGSDYLTHTPLLEYMGSTGIPVVVSTGMADQQDVDEAVAAVRRGSKSPLMLLHCTSAYPTPVESTNLLRMVTLRERYGVPVGYSDHTEGYQAAAQAVALGASMIEKHFTLDHDLPGPDQWFSTTPDEFARLVKEVRDAETRLGDRAIAPAAVEDVARQSYRLSIVAAVDFPKGTRLSEDLVTFRRPGTGILPGMLKVYLGRTFARDIVAGEPLKSEDFVANE